MSQSRRQEIRDKIKETSKQEFILAEMKKLGFWPNDEDAFPSKTAQLLKKEGKLTKELRELLARQKKFDNKEQVLKEIHQQRMVASRQRQKENKEKRKQERLRKAEAWKAKQAEEITYLGEEVSAGLVHTANDEERLKSLNLPVFASEKALAEQMGIDMGKLRFLTYNRKVSTVSHYKQFYMAKKSGGQRLISAPMPLLKDAQTWLLQTVLYKLPMDEKVHGFVPQRSILTNATPHVGKDLVINIDLKDFFPTVDYKRVKGLFRSFGYAERISTIFALLATELPTSEVTLDGKRYYVATGERHLPQGSPASPAITNLVCRKLDRRLSGLAQKYGFTYTRYADDMTFSADDSQRGQVPKILANIRRVIKDEGFTLHPDKLRVMKKGARKEVTGIVVNEKANVSGKDLKRFRALLYQIEKDGIEGKHWNNSTNLLAAIQGYANFIQMVNPEKGAVYVPRVKAILKKHGFKHEIKFPAKPKAKEGQTAKTTKGKKPWWKFWG